MEVCDRDDPDKYIMAYHRLQSAADRGLPEMQQRERALMFAIFGRCKREHRHQYGFVLIDKQRRAREKNQRRKASRCG